MKPIIPTRAALDILARPGLSDEQIGLCDMAIRVSESFADDGTAEMHYIEKLLAAGFLIKTRSRSEPYQFTEASAVLVALWSAIQGARAALATPSQPDRESEHSLRNALNEVVTNGRWTEGEQYGEWAISKEVYETARDELALTSTRPQATEGEK